jgi:uncharacterized protein (DUF302 family)
MEYFFSTLMHKTTHDQAIELVTEELKKEGFGVLTRIDVKETLKQKIDVDFRKYVILGACNPHFAHQALQVEGKIGVFLPCNVVVEEHENGSVEVSAVDPVPMMSPVSNPKLEELAGEVRERIRRVISETGKKD